MAAPAGFVGRKGELSRLVAALAGDVRLVPVVGDAGMPRMAPGSADSTCAASKLPGVPLGIGLFKAVAGHQTAPPSALWVAAAVLGTLLAVAGLTAVPALIGARIPAPQILQSETA
jgi:hypothetical protein